MNYSEKLLNKEVLCVKDGNKYVVIDVFEAPINEVSIKLNNSKEYLLILSLKKNAIRFEDAEIQNELMQEINNFELEQIRLEKEREEINKVAITAAKKKAESEKTQKSNSGNNRGNKDKTRADRKNAAYKATYCDGNGDWFRAPCSVECRNRNCSKNGGGRFCSTNSACREVLDGKKPASSILKEFVDKNLCYESRMLLDYIIYAGRDNDGTVRGWSLDKDRIVILTTVKPKEPEKERVIFGAFLIKQSYDKDKKEAYAKPYDEYKISLTEAEADKMKYWDYAPGEGEKEIIQWKEQLLRYQSDEMCATVLKDLVNLIEKRKVEEQTNAAKAFLDKYLSLIDMTFDQISEKHGARIKNSL